MYFHDLGLFYNDEKLISARDKALAKLLTMQLLNTDEIKIDGAFKGRYEGPKDAPGGGEVCVNNRTTTYAVMALLKLSSELKEIWLSRHNKRFTDRNHGNAIPNLVW